MNLKMVFGGDGVIRMPCAGVDINLAFGIGEITVSIQRNDLVKMRVTIHDKAHLFFLHGLFVQSMSRERNLAASHFIAQPIDQFIDGGKRRAIRDLDCKPERIHGIELERLVRLADKIVIQEVIADAIPNLLQLSFERRRTGMCLRFDFRSIKKLPARGAR